MSYTDLPTILEIVKTTAEFGAWTTLAVVVGVQSPKLLKIVLDFVLKLIKDLRTPPKPPKSPRPPQISKPQQG
ncbi:hypothetical protein [Bradyrhizobium sp. CCBAU 45321]|uniref:hypothetical protein n=1 Tax=Bradyrhizobium sp. CCBAU 45321 TaxID=1641878 RepID=UPI0023046A28|nr:hypothetical protein [Bradyrhizobium sp. CCBAU 45321]